MTDAATAFAPIIVTDVDVAGPLPHLVSTSDGGARYERARCLVRLDGDPVGIVVVDMPANGISPASLAGTIWQQLGDDLRDRAARQGRGPLTRLGGEGIGTRLATTARPHRGGGAIDATVVVATRDRAPSLERCLRSLLAMDRQPAAVIVVDNASSDDSARAVVTKLSTTSNVSTPICYVREDRAGLAVAHNAALPHVRTRIVAFTDDDVVVDRLWLGRMVDAFDAADNVACVTGMIVPAELETREQLWIEEYAGFNKGFERKVFDLAANRPDDRLFPFTAGALGSGANMAFTTACLRRLGGFDVALGAGSGGFGGDDLAAFHDAIASGGQLVYEPGAIVRHYHHRSYDSLRRQVYGYGAGLTAYLTHCLVARPTSVFAMAARSLWGIAHALGSRSPKNAARPSDYPSGLTWAERRGMIFGPVAYLRTRWARRAPTWATSVVPDGMLS